MTIEERLDKIEEELFNLKKIVSQIAKGLLEEPEEFLTEMEEI